jgi:organic radical activating enzyme
MPKQYHIDSFCSQPWSNLELTPAGDFKICCLANQDVDWGMALDKDGKVMNIMTHSFMDAINSETHKQHRLQYSRNEWPDRCINCKEGEKVKNKPDENGFLQGSARYQKTITLQKAISEIMTVERAESATAEDGSVKNYPVELDIRFGNLCNYKCIMCNPEFSNSWYDDWVDVHNTTTFSPSEFKSYTLIKDEHGRYKTDMPRFWETERWWQQIKEIAPHLRFIYFTGGEPLLVPAMDELLDYLIAEGYAKNIIIDFATNGSVYNKKIVERFKQFKAIQFMISVDDTELRHTLVRFPGNFDTLMKNIEAFYNNGMQFHALSGCIGLSTIYAPFRMEPLAKQYNTKYLYRFLYEPAEQNLKILPRSAKLEIIKHYVKNADTAGESGIAVCQYLKEHLDYEDLALVKKYVKFMDKLDQLRGTDWHTTLSDVYDLLTRHCPTAFDQ